MVTCASAEVLTKLDHRARTDVIGMRSGSGVSEKGVVLGALRWKEKFEFGLSKRAASVCSLAGTRASYVGLI